MLLLFYTQTSDECVCGICTCTKNFSKSHPASFLYLKNLKIILSPFVILFYTKNLKIILSSFVILFYTKNLKRTTWYCTVQL